MHGPINVKSPNNISKWQMEFNSAFKGLKSRGEVLLGENQPGINFGRGHAVVFEVQ
jgi:DNA-binding transcriptional regulator of glucitol operon